MRNSQLQTQLASNKVVLTYSAGEAQQYLNGIQQKISKQGNKKAIKGLT